MTKTLPSSIALLVLATAAPAQDADISHQRQVYREINAGAAAAGDQTIEGVFLGVEQGDYAHWKMRDRHGNERSFFILQTDAALERVLADPQEYEGRACRVRWERRKEEIPEAGGRMDLDVLTGVEWQ
jgi:hypothetical protein